MLTNYHTHSTFCDGKSTPEETVKAAIARGFHAIGFSGHGYTDYDPRYCMKDTDGYRLEILRLRELYKKEIEIYLGVEEDSHFLQKREDFDYIIGSCHYIESRNGLFPFDSNYETYFLGALAELDDDPIRLATVYYNHFCTYILSRRPDVIGHFDLPTKFDEKYINRFLLSPTYWSIAEKATRTALQSGSFFEVNTGLMARGFRTMPCPHERLLHLICKGGGEVVLSADAHATNTLDFAFEETRARLYDIGFRHTRVLYGGEWRRDPLTI